MNVRTRVAPSPTGSPHIGTAYIALFNLAFARKHGGQFILRIEDTDQLRSTPESEQEIMQALRWTGLAWDEGPDIGGACGPYRQSERTDIYRRHTSDLVAQGAAYPCFCSAQRLDELRARQQAEKAPLGYDGACAQIPRDEAQRRVNAGESHVIRMKVPADGECVFSDRLRGEIRIPWQQVDHQVLLKSDGFPTYHLANVVDDHLMGITHVIRGEEWISSTPKHVLLYQLFGWTPPQFAHLPLLRNPDKSKLSKRKNPTSILYYQRAGILPEALLNYLAGLAYSMPDGREIFSLQDLFDLFDLDRVSLGGPIFDPVKLKNFNGRYLRDLTPSALLQRLKDWTLNDDTWLRIIPLAQPRLDTLADLVAKAAFLFADELAYDVREIIALNPDTDVLLTLLKFAQWEFEKSGPWTKDRIKTTLERIAEKENLPLKQMLPLFFIALCGQKVSLPLFDSLEILGRDLTVRRLQYALEALEKAGHALSKKKLKAVTDDYALRYQVP